MPRDDESEVLIELVSRALARLEEEGHGALEAFLDEHPGHAKTVRRRLALLAGQGLQAAGEAAAPPEALGDFRLVEAIGRGGMGVVWRATQPSLGREVAVKLVRPDQLLFPGARERFRREVETIARLQHPGIVPVYGVGEARGLPYYAMELVPGATLAQIVEGLEGRDPAKLDGRDLFAALPPEDGADTPPALFEGPWQTVCVRIVREVAEALEHARRRGIVHRDVKPSNVMVTRGGRVLLLDFGLSTSAGDERLTKSGSTVGSIAYMAPERMPGAPEARAHVDADDPRQDVYSLGVTLYEILTLASPYAREDQLGLLRAALEGDVRPLRSLNRSVSADVATLIGVAMDRDPARRYPTAGAMARDLGNVLEHRPLEARPPGALLRARRWLQRNPVAATLYAAGVLVPTLLLLQELRNLAIVEDKNASIQRQAEELQSTNEDLEAALAVSAEQRARAEAALEKAMEAVDRMLVRVGDEALLDVPGLEQVRRELLTEALGFQRWFLANAERTDPLRTRLARVAVSAAEVQGLLDELAGAGEALEVARAVLEEVPADEADAEVDRLLAKTYAVGAKLAKLRQDAPAAERAEARALELLGDTSEASPELAALGCSVRVDRAQRLLEGGDLGTAERELRLAIEDAAPLQDAWDGDPLALRELRSELARAYTTLSLLLDARAQRGPGAVRGEYDPELVARGLAAAAEAQRLAEGLLELEPQSAGTKHRAARAASVVGVLESRTGDLRASRTALERTVELLRELATDHPAVATYHFDLGTALGNLGGLARREGDGETGERLTREGAEALRRYFESGGTDVTVRTSYAGLLLNLGTMRELEGDEDGALDYYARAQAPLDRALTDAPDLPQARYVEAVSLEQALPLFSVRGRTEELIGFLSAYVERAEDEDAAVDVLAAVASWPDAAIEAEVYDDAEVERVARTVEDVAAELIRTGLEEGRWTRARLRAEPRLELLRSFGRVAEALAAR